MYLELTCSARRHQQPACAAKQTDLEQWVDQGAEQFRTATTI